MKDRKGVTIHDGDIVKVQTVKDGPITDGQVISCTNVRCKELKSVLVEFSNGSRQYMGGEHLEVQ